MSDVKLPDAMECAEKFHDASYRAVTMLADAQERYGPGLRREDKR